MIRTVMFFPSGVTAVLDERGRQIPECQESWLRLFVESLKKYEPTIDVTTLELHLPDGRLAVPVHTSRGWSWDIKEGGPGQ